MLSRTSFGRFPIPVGVPGFAINQYKNSRQRTGRAPMGRRIDFHGGWGGAKSVNQPLPLTDWPGTSDANLLICYGVRGVLLPLAEIKLTKDRMTSEAPQLRKSRMSFERVKCWD